MSLHRRLPCRSMIFSCFEQIHEPVNVHSTKTLAGGVEIHGARGDVVRTQLQCTMMHLARLKGSVHGHGKKSSAMVVEPITGLPGTP